MHPEKFLRIGPGTGARAHPPEFDARKILQPFLSVLIGLSITHIKALIAVTVAGCCKKTLVIFVFAQLTPDGFHFWMTLSPRARVRPGAELRRRHCIGYIPGLQLRASAPLIDRRIA